MTSRYHVTIRALPDGDPDRCEGSASTVAAFMRAAANEISPVQPNTRTGASGASTTIRNSRDFKLGFGIPTATNEEQA